MDEIKEGTLHKRVEIQGVTFEIYYGYSVEGEKEYGWEPSPIYPDFIEQPQHTRDGYPFATVDQDRCEHYDPISRKADDHWCYNCKLFEKHETYIGVCKCECRRQRKNDGNGGADAPCQY